MKKIPLIDLHQDIADNCLIISGKNFFEKNNLHQGKNMVGLPVNNQVDWLRLKKANARLIFAASCPFVVKRGKIKIAENPLAATFEQLNFYFSLLKKNKKLTLVKNYKDYLMIKKESRIGLLLHIEGADFVDNHLINLELVYNLGVRSVGLTHNEKNKLAGGAMSKGGLTKLGIEVIKKAQQLGMIIDLAHLNKRSFNQAIKLIKPPFMVSHCGIEAIKKHPRNLNDEQLKLIKEKGGVIGLAFAPNFYPDNQLDTLVKAFKHIKKLIGTENICIGSDFDGIISEKLFSSLEEVSQVRNLEKALIRGGFKKREVEEIFYKNVERRLIKELIM